MNDAHDHELIRQPARKQALISVRQFENGLRAACAPERQIRPIVTALPRVKAHQLAFTPDGKWLMVACTTNVFVLAVPQGKCAQVLNPAKAYFNTATISPDGTAIVTGEPSGLIKLWDVATGECLRTMSGHDGGGIKKLAVSPDGSLILSITLSLNSEIGVWDLHSGKCLHLVSRGVKDFAIAPDSKTAVTGEGDTLRVLDLQSGQYRREYPCNADIDGLALSADGRTVVAVEGGRVSNSCRRDHFRILDLSTGASRLIDTGIYHEFFAVHPEGDLLIAPECDFDNRYYATRKVFFWDLKTGSRLEPFQSEFRFPMAFSRDGQWLAGFGGDGLKLWELQDQSAHRIWHSDPIQNLFEDKALALNGNWLLTQGADQGINIWDTQTGEVHPRLQGQLSDMEHLAVSPDCGTVISSHKDKTVRVWAGPDPQCTHIWKVEEFFPYAAVAFHPDGRQVAYADKQRIFIRDLPSGKLNQTLEGYRYTFKDLAFSRDGRSLLSEGYTVIYWWDLNWGQCLFKTRQIKDYQKFDGHELGKITAHLINPDDLTCIVGEWHSEGEHHDFIYQAHWLDLQSGRYLQRFDGHTQDIISIAADPDWQTMVTYDKDGNLFQWRLATGEKVRAFKGHSQTSVINELGKLFISPDGKRLIAWSKGGLLYFWSMTNGELLATAYNLDQGYLWTTPPDDFAPNGWLHTDRPDLVSLLEADKVDGNQPEYVFEADTRFEDYLKLYNDGEMVMTRLNDWDRYRQLLAVRLGNKAAMDDHLLARGKTAPLRLPDRTSPED